MWNTSLLIQRGSNSDLRVDTKVGLYPLQYWSCKTEPYLESVEKDTMAYCVKSGTKINENHQYTLTAIHRSVNIVLYFEKGGSVQCL